MGDDQNKVPVILLFTHIEDHQRLGRPQQSLRLGDGKRVSVVHRLERQFKFAQCGPHVIDLGRQSLHLGANFAFDIWAAFGAGQACKIGHFVLQLGLAALHIRKVTHHPGLFTTALLDPLGQRRKGRAGGAIIVHLSQTKGFGGGLVLGHQPGITHPHQRFLQQSAASLPRGLGLFGHLPCGGQVIHVQLHRTKVQIGAAGTFMRRRKQRFAQTDRSPHIHKRLLKFGLAEIAPRFGKRPPFKKFGIGQRILTEGGQQSGLPSVKDLMHPGNVAQIVQNQGVFTQGKNGFGVVRRMACLHAPQSVFVLRGGGFELAQIS